MILVSKNGINILKEWGKPSNINRSKKLHIMSFYFIHGKMDEIKVRIKAGQFISNIKTDPKNGMQEYFKFLVPIMMIKNDEKSLVTIKNTRVDIYQLMELQPNPNERSKYFCTKYASTNMENTYALLEDVYKADYDKNHKTEESNLKDYKHIFQYRDKEEYEVQYLAIRTSYISQNKETNNEETIVVWHLIGVDVSIASEYYTYAEEFAILPYPPDLGQVEEIKM